jgi:hypothetical protein
MPLHRRVLVVGHPAYGPPGKVVHLIYKPRTQIFQWARTNLVDGNQRLPSPLRTRAGRVYERGPVGGPTPSRGSSSGQRDEHCQGERNSGCPVAVNPSVVLSRCRPARRGSGRSSSGSVAQRARRSRTRSSVVRRSCRRRFRAACSRRELAGRRQRRRR